MSERERKYHRDYYHNVRHPKDKAFKAVAAASCQLCGDEWANTHVGWNAEIFVCLTCDAKLSEWDREKEDREREWATRCQVCGEEPAVGVDESTQLRCCLSIGCIDYLDWLSEPTGEANPWGEGDPWDTDEKLGHLFESVGAQFHEPPAVASLCGVEAPIRAFRGDMTMPSALRRWGLCVACLQACPDPAGLAWKDRNYFAYVIPAQTQETAPAVGTS